MVTKAEIRDYFAKFGREGGKATARNRTPEERSAAARKAVQARWDKQMKQIVQNLAKMDEHLTTLQSRQRKRAKRAKKV